MKTCLAQPNGEWGTVFRGWDKERPPGLAYVAFGRRYPRRPDRRRVSQLAHRRLHAGL